MYKQVMRFCAVLALITSVAHAKTGKPDLGNYVGSDSLAPAPSLPASFNTLVHGTAGGFVPPSVTMNLPADGDDAMYAINLGANASLYGTALSSCNVSMNGYIT